MKWRSTVVLLVVACGLGLYLYFFERQQPAKAQLEEEKRRLFRVSADDIDRLRITHGDVVVALERESALEGAVRPGEKEPQWRMTAPVAARASGWVCAEVVRDLASLDWESRVAGDSQKVSERGLAEPRATLSFRERGKEETLEFGDDAPLGDRVYARRAGPDLYEVRKSFLTSLLKGVEEFRDTTVLPFTVTDVEKFSVTRQGERLVAERKGRDWRLLEPFPTGTRGDRDKLEEAVKKLNTLRVERFVADAPDTPSPEVLASYGLATPVVVAELQAGGKSLRCTFGGPVPEHPEWRYASTGEGRSVTAVKADVAESLARPFLEFRDHRLGTLRADRVETLTVSLAPAREGEEPQTVEIVRKEAQGGTPARQPTGAPAEPPWRVTKPRDIEADQDAVRELLRDVDTRMVLDFVDLPGPPVGGEPPGGAPAPASPAPGDLAAYGLDKPLATLTLTGGAGEKEVIQVGSAEAQGGRVYLRRDQEPTVLAVAPEFAHLALRGYVDYRTKKLTEVNREDVTRIHVDRPGGAVELVKENNEWQLVAPKRARAERPAVDDLLFELAPLHAESIVAEEAKDLSPYGLDKPAYRLEVEAAKAGEKPGGPSGGSTVVSLGQAAAEGGRYARLGSEGLVVTLPMRLSERLDAEFRYRTLLAFDRDKVEELDLQGVTPEVVAVKVAGAWQLREPAGQSLDETKVNGLVDSLKNLRVERWVTYEATDLSPYGLEKPVAVVSVHVGGLERETHTVAFGGEAEGGDVFARMEGDPGVFLLSRRLLEKVQAPLLVQPEGEGSSAPATVPQGTESSRAGSEPEGQKAPAETPPAGEPPAAAPAPAEAPRLGSP